MPTAILTERKVISFHHSCILSYKLGVSISHNRSTHKAKETTQSCKGSTVQIDKAWQPQEKILKFASSTFAMYHQPKIPPLSERKKAATEASSTHLGPSPVLEVGKGRKQEWAKCRR